MKTEDLKQMIIEAEKGSAGHAPSLTVSLAGVQLFVLNELVEATKLVAVEQELTRETLHTCLEAIEMSVRPRRGILGVPH